MHSADKAKTAVPAVASQTCNYTREMTWPQFQGLFIPSSSNQCLSLLKEGGGQGVWFGNTGRLILIFGTDLQERCFLKKRGGMFSLEET